MQQWATSEVTLVLDDGQQSRAHKVVLGSSNAFLRTVGLGTWYRVVLLQLGWVQMYTPSAVPSVSWVQM